MVIHILLDCLVLHGVGRCVRHGVVHGHTAATTCNLAVHVSLCRSIVVRASARRGAKICNRYWRIFVYIFQPDFCVFFSDVNRAQIHTGRVCGPLLANHNRRCKDWSERTRRVNILPRLCLLCVSERLRRVVSHRPAIYIRLSSRVVILGRRCHFQAGNWRHTSHGVRAVRNTSNVRARFLKVDACVRARPASRYRPLSADCKPNAQMTRNFAPLC